MQAAQYQTFETCTDILELDPLENLSRENKTLENLNEMHTQWCRTKLISNTWAKFKITRRIQLLISDHKSQFVMVMPTYMTAKFARHIAQPTERWLHDASIWFCYWAHSPESQAKRPLSAVACSMQLHCFPPPAKHTIDNELVSFIFWI